MAEMKACTWSRRMRHWNRCRRAGVHRDHDHRSNLRGSNRADLAGARSSLADIVSPEQLEANYIRRSDAEIFAKRLAINAHPFKCL